jgi:hypothetical protein
MSAAKVDMFAELATPPPAAGIEGSGIRADKLGISSVTAGETVFNRLQADHALCLDCLCQNALLIA